jgi:hypothetical protein
MSSMVEYDVIRSLIIYYFQISSGAVHAVDSIIAKTPKEAGL